MIEMPDVVLLEEELLNLAIKESVKAALKEKLVQR